MTYTVGEQKPAKQSVLAPSEQVTKQLVGVDVFLDWEKGNAEQLSQVLKRQQNGHGLQLTLITNRGARVWPDGLPETFTTDHWRCRYLSETKGDPIQHAQILELLQHIDEGGLDFIKTENLYTFDGKPGYSSVPGE